MTNIKKLGNENERRICRIIAEFTGAEFKRTELSGGASRAGDIYDYSNSSPLSKYTIEIKYHGNEKNFRKDIVGDLKQAINQCRADKNFMLITKMPGKDMDLVIMDLKDYLCNDIAGQMQVSKKEAKQEAPKEEKKEAPVGNEVSKGSGNQGDSPEPVEEKKESTPKEPETTVKEEEKVKKEENNPTE